MPKVGDQIEVKSKVGARTGKVTAVSGQLLRVLWDTGEETSILPAAGVLSIVPGAARPRSRTKATSPRKVTGSKAPSEPRVKAKEKGKKKPKTKATKEKQGSKSKGDRKKK